MSDKVSFTEFDLETKKCQFSRIIACLPRTQTGWQEEEAILGHFGDGLHFVMGQCWDNSATEWIGGVESCTIGCLASKFEFYLFTETGPFLPSPIY